MFINKSTRLIVLIISSIFAFGCHDASNARDDALSQLETEVSFSDLHQLPQGAVLEVRLQDVSQMDVASELISSASRPIKGAPPYSLRLAFPTKMIKTKRSYSIDASIKVDDKLHFISTTHTDPFAIGVASPIQVKLEQVGG